MMRCEPRIGFGIGGVAFARARILGDGIKAERLAIFFRLPAHEHEIRGLQACGEGLTLQLIPLGLAELGGLREQTEQRPTIEHGLVIGMPEVLHELAPGLGAHFVESRAFFDKAVANAFLVRRR